MASIQQANLSTNDLHILHSVFDPESTPSPSITIDSTLPSDPTLPPATLAALQALELSAIRHIEAVPPHAPPAEKHAAYTRALAQLDAAVAAAPAYASARNNRAQLRRWRFGDHICGSAAAEAEAAGALALALADLDAAIAGAAHAGAAVAAGQARVLRSAWAQRGAVLFAVARDLARARAERLPEGVVRAVGSAVEGALPEWVGWGRARFEEEASRCFFVAGVYGCEGGRALAVVSNPYARLCGAIVKEAVRGEVMG